MHLHNLGALLNALLASSIASDDVRPYEFHVAPMQGYTNAPLRHLFHLLSPNAILWTEMEKVKDLHQASLEALRKRFGDPTSSEKLVLQLGGNHVPTMEECVFRLEELGYRFREANLNCGCPSIEAGGADFGASLMKQPDLTRQLIESISRASSEDTKISLKCRTAVFDTLEEFESVLSGSKECWWKDDQHFQSLCSYIESAKEGGVSHVVLHARPAILSGLSPTKNRLVPPLDYDFVTQVAAEFPSLRVTLNGGIQSLDDLLGLQNDGRIQSHMAGRWLLRHPLSLARIEDHCLNQGTTTTRYSSLESLESAVDKYMQFVDYSIHQKIHSLSDLCLPLYLVIEEMQEIFDKEEEVQTAWTTSDEEQLYETLKEAIEHLTSCLPNKKSKPLPDHIHWKRLSAALKSVVGTKVYNKWKRNRNEL